MSISVKIKSPLGRRDIQLIRKTMRVMQTTYNYPIESWNQDFYTLTKNKQGEEEFNIKPDLTTLDAGQQSNLFLARFKEEAMKQQQDAACMKLMQNAQEKGLNLTGQYIEDDDTIVLTYNVK